MLISKLKNINHFDKLVKDNKVSGRPWYFGLEGNWWWGMTEDDVRKNISLPRIAIASIIRDEEKNGNLERFLNCCDELEQYHRNIIYIFIEGDSADDTYIILKDWINQKEGILEKINRGYPPFSKDRDTKRTKYFAELRNRLIELALYIPKINEILMVDANYGWRGDIIKSLREANADICAPLVLSHFDDNGNRFFFDIWGFRKNGKEFTSGYPYAEDMKFDRPVEIDSAGACYLIKRIVLDAGVKYNGSQDCEHISFCTQAKDLGFSIMLNPNVFVRKGGNID